MARKNSNDGKSGEEIARDMVRKLEARVERARADAQFGPPKPSQLRSASIDRFYSELDIIYARFRDIVHLREVTDTLQKDLDRRLTRLINFGREYGKKEQE